MEGIILCLVTNLQKHGVYQPGRSVRYRKQVFSDLPVGIARGHSYQHRQAVALPADLLVSYRDFAGLWLLWHRSNCGHPVPAFLFSHRTPQTALLYAVCYLWNLVIPNILTLFGITKIGGMRYEKLFFVGHKEADERLLPCLTEVIRQLVTEEDVRHFYVGGYGDFDRSAGKAVKEVKKQYTDVTLNLVLPYHSGERSVEVPPGYDGTYYPKGLENVPRQYAIIWTNKIMVDTSGWLIAYVRYGASNSRKFLEYAQRREKNGFIGSLIRSKEYVAKDNGGRGKSAFHLYW